MPMKYFGNVISYRLDFQGKFLFKNWPFQVFGIPVCPSVCLSVRQVYQSKTVEGRIAHPSTQSSPISLVS